MHFPAWVDGPRKTKAQRASARLKFIINTLAAATTERGTVRQFSVVVGLDHSTISGYIRRGSFSEKCARTICAALPAGTITTSHLTHPLDIKQ